MGKLHLQRAFARTGAPAKDFQDNACSIDDLGAPGFFQIALLNRRERAIDDDYADLYALDQSGKLIELAFADEACGTNAAQGNDPGRDHIEVNGAGKAHGLL